MAFPAVNMKGLAALAVAAVVLVHSPHGLGQPAERKVRVGIMVGGSLAKRDHLEKALLQGLRDQGYEEGRNLVIERRYADGRGERVPQFAQELAGMKLDAVITTCTPTTRAAQKVMGSTPIVMAAVADPVGQHLIASLARPGANITGLSSQAEDIMPKMLSLFARVLPPSTTIAVLAESRSEVHQRMWLALGPVAKELKVRLVKVEVGRPPDVQIPVAFERALREKAGAIFVLPDEPMFLSWRSEIVAQAARHRIPAFYGAREFVDDGGLMSFGENLRTAYRGAAAYVRKVAGGAAPAEIPVGQPTRFELVINQKTARALGLSIPRPILLSADDVIE